MMPEKKYPDVKKRVGHEEVWLKNILCRSRILGKTLKWYILCLIESDEHLG